MNNILLIGKGGQVGWELERTLSTLGNLVSVERKSMDLVNPDDIRKVIREVKPKIIVNAAAYTAVDNAEKEQDIAMAVNGTAPGVIAEEAKKQSAALIHYSTDYVFDGEKGSPYSETDVTNPCSVYGKTKLEGERAIQAVDIPYLILRTSWVYGTRGKNFLLTIKKLASERDTLSIVDDQLGAPTWCRLIAEATSHILAGYRKDTFDAIHDVKGVYHLTCGGVTSWFGFAKKMLENENRYTEGHLSLSPIPSSEYVTPAKRPMYSVLDNSKLNETFGIKLPDWDEALDMVLSE